MDFLASLPAAAALHQFLTGPMSQTMYLVLLLPFLFFLAITFASKDLGSWAMAVLLVATGAAFIVLPYAPVLLAAAAAVGSLAVVGASRARARLRVELQEMREQILGMVAEQNRRILRELKSTESGNNPIPPPTPSGRPTDADTPVASGSSASFAPKPADAELSRIASGKGRAMNVEAKPSAEETKASGEEAKSSAEEAAKAPIELVPVSLADLAPFLHSEFQPSETSSQEPAPAVVKSPETATQAIKSPESEAAAPIVAEQPVPRALGEDIPAAAATAEYSTDSVVAEANNAVVSNSSDESAQTLEAASTALKDDRDPASTPEAPPASPARPEKTAPAHLPSAGPFVVKPLQHLALLESVGTAVGAAKLPVTGPAQDAAALTKPEHVGPATLREAEPVESLKLSTAARPSVAVTTIKIGIPPRTVIPPRRPSARSEVYEVYSQALSVATASKVLNPNGRSDRTRSTTG